MCLALYRPKGVVLNNTVYEEAYRRNDDGGGFCYVDTATNGKREVVYQKGFFTIDKMLEAMAPHRNKEMLVHFRRASAGGVSTDNCHPFVFRSAEFPEYTFGVIHNGTLPFRSTTTKSDTACFVDDILRPLLSRDPYFFDNTPGTWMMEKIIGFSNKVLIMRHDSTENKTEVYILNPEQGMKYRGCWMSNASFVPLPPVKTVVADGAHNNWGYPRTGADWYGKHGYTQGNFSDKWSTDNYFVDPVTKMYVRKPLVLRDIKDIPPLPKKGSLLLKVLEQAVKRLEIEMDLAATDAKATTALTDIEKKFENLVAHNKGEALPFPDLGVPGKPVGTDDLTTSEHARVEAIFQKAKSDARPTTGGDVAPVIPISEGAKGEGDQSVKPVVDKKIEVPRDGDRKIVRGTYWGLGKKKKRIILPYLQEYLENQMVPEWEKMSFHEQLCWIRQEFRDTIPDLEKLTDAGLDQWLVDEIDQMEADEDAEEQIKELEKEQKAQLQIEVRADTIAAAMPDWPMDGPMG